MNEILDDISDKIFLEKLKNEFKVSIEDYAVKLSVFYEKRNYAGMRKIAHDIKGIASVFGFDRGSELAAELLKYTDSGDKKNIKGQYLDLLKYLNEIILEKPVEE